MRMKVQNLERVGCCSKRIVESIRVAAGRGVEIFVDWRCFKLSIDISSFLVARLDGSIQQTPPRDIRLQAVIERSQVQIQEKGLAGESVYRFNWIGYQMDRAPLSLPRRTHIPTRLRLLTLLWLSREASNGASVLASTVSSSASHWMN